MKVIKLEELSIESLKKISAWKILKESYDDYEFLITPADINSKGAISKKNGQVWCLTDAVFSNGDRKTACSLCRGDSDEGPLLWSVWNGVKFIVLTVPPAPDFVLKVDGPTNFCKKFGKTKKEVFPIKFEVLPSFEIKPHKRSIIIDVEGVKKR